MHAVSLFVEIVCIKEKNYKHKNTMLFTKNESNCDKKVFVNRKPLNSKNYIDASLNT